MSVSPVPEPTAWYALIVAFESRDWYSACAAFCSGAAKDEPAPAIVADCFSWVSQVKYGSGLPAFLVLASAGSDASESAVAATAVTVIARRREFFI